MDVRLGLREYRKFIGRALEIISYIPNEYISPRVMRAWEGGQLLTPSWQKDGQLARTWVNVVAHNAAVGLMAYWLAERLEYFLAREGSSSLEVVEAALVHDSFKRREQERKDLALEEGGDVNAAEQEAEYESDAFLLSLGFTSRVVLLAGSTGFKGRKLVCEATTPVLLAQKIVFYADCCVSNHKIVGYKKRFDDLKPDFEPGGRYEDTNRFFLKEYGKTHREVWDESVLPIELALAKLSGFSGRPEDLYLIASYQA